MLYPNFDWDPQKELINISKHGISFAKAILIFSGPIVSAVDSRRDYGEVRRTSIGQIDRTIVVVVVHTDRHGTIRIISARRASQAERRKYFEAIAK